MLAPIAHFLALTNIRRTRLLPYPGRVLVKAGQKVNAAEVIAETHLPNKHHLLDVRRAFGVSGGIADSLITRQKGEHLQKGDIVAETGKVFSRVIRAPVDGSIVAISNGQILIEASDAPLELQAAMPGVIREVIQEQGAVVEVNGVLLQGMWGNGKIDFGLLHLYSTNPEAPLMLEEIDPILRGAVLVGGYCGDSAFLHALEDSSLRGLILSSIHPDLIDLAGEMKFPVIVLEGFNRQPFNPVAFNLLITNEKKDVSLNAAAWNQISGERPEIIIPLPDSGMLSTEYDEVAPGLTVRIQGAPYANLIGTVLEVYPQTSLPNGLRCQAAEVRLPDKERVLVPISNLEIIA
ncbi:MAG: hypothetical protein AB9891_09675 [Anaerolineaceae bacterium]